MKPGCSNPSTSKKRALMDKSKFKENFVSKTKKSRHRSLKNFMKLKGLPLVAQVPVDSSSDDDEESSNDESSSDDGNSDHYTETEHTDEEMVSTLPNENNVHKKKKVLTILAEKSGSVILVVNHPISFTINGTAAIQVISGSANVLGYALDDSVDFVSIFSAKDICHLSVETTSYCVKTNLYWSVLTEKLKCFAHDHKVALIKEAITESSVVIVLMENWKANFIKFAQFHIPLALPLCPSPNTNQLAELGFTIGSIDESTVELSKNYSDVIEIIKCDIQSFLQDGGRAPSIFIYGQKGLGKSTTLRYFINKVLSCNYGRRIFYLDIDPGQPEFTLPGCISLTEIKKPLLGPSYTHLETPIICKFFGHLSLENNVRRYYLHLSEVLQFYLDHFSNEILFINTLGWIRGFGRDALGFVEEKLQPTIQVELVRNNSDVAKCNLGLLKAYPRKLKISSHAQDSTPTVLAATRRGIQILSYFGKCMQNPCQSLSSSSCYRVSLEDVAIHVIDKEELDLDTRLTVINGGVVALCRVENHEIHQPEDENDSLCLLPESSFGQCLGFGFIKAIHPVDKLLYIATPVEYMRLRKVNVLIKGNVQMPAEAFLKQTSFTTADCYIDNDYKSCWEALGEKS